MNWQDTFIEVDEKELFVRIWEAENQSDEKAPIILFHDSLGCVELWRNFPAALSYATQRKVIAYDRFGYGKSSPNPDEQSLDFVSQEAEIYFPALLQQLNIKKFVAFGHSVGGGMAVHCAAKFPDACEALITESAQAFVEDRTLEGIREAKVAFTQTSNVERLKKYHGDKALWVLHAWTETWLSSAFSAWNLKAILPQVQCPTLVLHGSEDEYGTTQHPQIIHEFSGGQSEMKILSDLKHVPHREQEQTVIELVVEFLG